jgi:hypothetical protein
MGACVGLAGVVTSAAAGADIVLSEYNAVAPDKWVGNPNDPLCEGPAGIDCSNRSDTFFGRIMGNGGNWFELMVVTDHLDMRGWTLYWEEVNALKEGTIFLSDDPAWSDLRAGTVLTFTELTTAEGGLDTDLGFDPCRGDWWINVNTFDTQYVPTTETNVKGDGPGNFSVGNNDWRITVRDGSGATVFGPAGEGAVDYTGTSVNSREICRLQADPSAAVTPTSDYDDGTRSSFGSPNNWEDALNCRIYQEFDGLRAAQLAACESCQPVTLNEYNAVSDGFFLNGGTLELDEDGGQAGDVFFGRVLDNAGDWIEVIVVQDHLDMRGWRLVWEEEGASGEIQLSDDAFWSDMTSGTILTLIERTTAGGGLDTDLSFDPDAGDRWINVNTFDTTYVASTTSTVEPHVPGEFSTSNADWRLTILDGDGLEVAPAAGEGSIAYFRDGVGKTNVMRLEESPSGALTPLSAYDDGSSLSTFGAANVWTECPDPTPVTQDFGGLPDALCAGAPCPADIDGSGDVGFQDLLALLAAWGPCPGCPEDLDGSGEVGFQDLLELLAAWGPCP